MREEWLAWQDVVEALETDFGITREQFNDIGHTTVKAILYWHHMKARLEDSINTRVPARATVDAAEQKGHDSAR